MRKVLYIIVLLLISYATFGQENESNAGDPNQTVIDSLLRLANTDVPDSTRAILYSEIASKSGNNSTNRTRRLSILNSRQRYSTQSG